MDIRRARKFIHDRCDGPLSLKDVARAAKISGNHLSEKFRQITGLRFVDYVARVRVEKACTLLCNSKLRVSEIAFAAGFQSLSQFNRVFKKITGETPRAYRSAQPGRLIR